MKTASIACLVLASLLVVLNHLANYWLGYSETIRAEFAADPVIGLFSMESAPFLILIILAIITLFLKKHRVWLLAVLISFWPLVILIGFLTLTFCGTGPSLILRGLHDRIMHDYTLDDLRHFASDVDQAGILKSGQGYVDHGDISSLNLTYEQKEAFAQLRKKYPFMHWMDEGRFLHGPSILNYEEKGVVDFEWGGALSGHWGCSISTNGTKNASHPDSQAVILRLSDDIYLYFD
jgi:energy-coupling factor transporter transmembrane protein EcfT